MSSTHHLQQPERPHAETGPGYLLLALSALWCIYWFVHAWHYWEDDAYIHLVFARSVASGLGFAFNGRVVAGDTAPLWVFMLAAMHALIPNWLIAGKVLTVLGALVGFAGIYAFARRLTAQLLPDTAIFPSVAVLLIAVNPYTCYWLYSGMESITAAGVACFAVLAATRARPTPMSFLAACLLAGIGPLLRPELVFLSALLLLPLWGQARRLATAGRSTHLLGLLLLAGPVLLWSIYSFHAFGHVLPNTNAAKRALPGQSVIVRLLSIYSVGFPSIVCGALAAAASFALRASAVRDSLRAAVVSTLRASTPDAATKTGKTLPLAGWIFILWVAIATVFYIANHTYVQTRYILVPAPGIIVVVLLQFFKLSRIAGRALCVFGLAAAIGVSLIVVRPFVRNKATSCLTTQNFALFIRDGIPSGAPVAAYAIGQLAFVSQHPIIDTGGIVQPESIPYLKAHPNAVVQWAASAGAQYYVESHSPTAGATAVYTASFPFIGWTLHSSRYATSGPGMLWKLPAQSFASRNLHP